MESWKWWRVTLSIKAIFNHPTQPRSYSLPANLAPLWASETGFLIYGVGVYRAYIQEQMEPEHRSMANNLSSSKSRTAGGDDDEISTDSTVLVEWQEQMFEKFLDSNPIMTTSDLDNSSIEQCDGMVTTLRIKMLSEVPAAASFHSNPTIYSHCHANICRYMPPRLSNNSNWR